LKLHQKDVIAASVAVPIQGAFCTASYPSIIARGIDLKGVSIVNALTTALVSPLVDTLGIEFHQEDVMVACVAVSIKGASRVASHPGMAVHIHLKSPSIVTALTTALARPQVDTLGIEFHQEDVIRARVGVPIQGAKHGACHPGIANVVHLQSPSIVTSLTTALARPQVHALGIEFHQKDVIQARIGVPIQGAPRGACHPGIANVVHLQSPSLIPAPTTALARPQVDTLGIEFHQKNVIPARVGVPIQGVRRPACHPGIANVVHLKSPSIVIAPTTTLASPQVDTLGIEFHQKDVRRARVGIAIQGAQRVACHPGIANVVHLQSLSLIPALTTTLARPQVDALGIEFHQKDVSTARIGVPIQGATRVACHPGIANVVHLKGISLIIILTTALACPLVDDLRCCCPNQQA